MTKDELRAKIIETLGWCPEILTDEEETVARKLFEDTPNNE